MQPQLPVFTRRYPTDAHYTADAAQTTAAGWRVVSIQREPTTGAIVATYALLAAVSPQTPQIARPAQRVRRGLDFRWLIGGGVVVGIIVLAKLAAIVSEASNRTLTSAIPTSGASTSAQATASVAYAATIQAMSQPQPTTPLQATPVTGARLGGPISDCAAAFVPAQGQDVWYTTLGGQSVML